jgi:hypothetical protein
MLIEKANGITYLYAPLGKHPDTFHSLTPANLVQYIYIINSIKGGKQNENRSTRQNSCVGYSCVWTGRSTRLEWGNTGNL